MHAQQTQMLLRKWRKYSPAGLTLIGLGCSVLGESIARKASSSNIWEWFWWGCAALVFINAGIAVFGEAIKCRVLYEIQHQNQATNDL
jgi:hypothetical protein